MDIKNAGVVARQILPPEDEGPGGGPVAHQFHVASNAEPLVRRARARAAEGRAKGLVRLDKWLKLLQMRSSTRCLWDLAQEPIDRWTRLRFPLGDGKAPDL